VERRKEPNLIVEGKFQRDRDHSGQPKLNWGRSLCSAKGEKMRVIPARGETVEGEGRNWGGDRKGETAEGFTASESVETEAEQVPGGGALKRQSRGTSSKSVLASKRIGRTPDIKKRRL